MWEKEKKRGKEGEKGVRRRSMCAYLEKEPQKNILSLPKYCAVCRSDGGFPHWKNPGRFQPPASTFCFRGGWGSLILFFSKKKKNSSSIFPIFFFHFPPPQNTHLHFILISFPSNAPPAPNFPAKPSNYPTPFSPPDFLISSFRSARPTHQPHSA